MSNTNSQMWVNWGLSFTESQNRKITITSRYNFYDFTWQDLLVLEEQEVSSFWTICAPISNSFPVTVLLLWPWMQAVFQSHLNLDVCGVSLFPWKDFTEGPSPSCAVSYKDTKTTTLFKSAWDTQMSVVRVSNEVSIPTKLKWDVCAFVTHAYYTWC
jgi:hypothetical protein